MSTKKPSRAIGRCPDCGAAVEVEIQRPHPARVLPHACRGRACEYTGCPVTDLPDRMVQLDSGAGYCPRHGLLVATKTLVALYKVEGDADWSAICELIAEVLPDVIRKVEAAENGSRSPGGPASRSRSDD